MAARATANTSQVMATKSPTANATRATTPSVSPLIASRIRRKIREGASHPSRTVRHPERRVVELEERRRDDDRDPGGEPRVARERPQPLPHGTPPCDPHDEEQHRQGRSPSRAPPSTGPRRPTSSDRRARTRRRPRSRARRAGRCGRWRPPGTGRPGSGRTRPPRTPLDLGRCRTRPPDHERRGKARGDRDHAERVDEHVEAMGDPRHDPGEMRTAARRPTACPAGPTSSCVRRLKSPGVCT